ncbi:MAG TPA: hypothetical protein VEN31_02310 [Candidatus Bathyarchaeia archaeon]|nr:hypothetical protein [Candidatus Bathyarchaeia archaeon]
MRLLRILALIALCLAFTPISALAVTGYDSAYAGESAFVTIDPGQTQSFQVFFSNTGTVSWAKGTGTQVDLAACLADKVTCNSQDATDATWNSGWLSATRYATATQATVAPGSVATFTYNIKAPTDATGTRRFNGDLVVASSGARIHPEGYYQDATVNAVGSVTGPTPTPGSTPFPSAPPATAPPPTPTPNPLTCFSSGGGQCQIVGPNAATLNNTAGGVSGVYFPISRLTGKAVADVSGLSFDFTGIARGGAPRISVPIDTNGDGTTEFYAFISSEFCPTTQTGHVSESTCQVFATGQNNNNGYANWAAFAAANTGATIAATDGDPTVPFIVADVSGVAPTPATWTLSNVHLGE